MLQHTNAITVGNKIEQTDTAPPSCELIIDGQPTGQRLAGVDLEAALECDAGYLVFLTHDCPFEETLSIYLLDAAGILQDSVHIGGMYTTGVFRNLQIQPPEKVSFAFFAELTYTVKLLACPEFCLPFFAGLPGVSRRFFFKRHFVVTYTRHDKKVYPIVVLFRKILNVLRFKNQNGKNLKP